MQPRRNRWQQVLDDDLRPALAEVGTWLRFTWRLSLRGLAWLLNILLSRSRRGRWLRWGFLTFGALLVWVFMAWRAFPGDTGLDWELLKAQFRYVGCALRAAIISDVQPPCYVQMVARSFTLKPLVFEEPIRMLFAPQVFRHILVLGFAVWVALKLVAYQQANLYELDDMRAAENYILQSALINRYDLLDIQGDQYPARYRQRPVFRIGGPGFVRVDLEHAALFEGIDGTPRVIGPTMNNRRQCEVLAGFESLRKVIDIRDQREQFRVNGRSRDGIRVTADDVQVVYSIYRNHREPTLERPYPFDDPRAVERLAYEQGTGPWNIAMGVQIRGELYDFFARKTLTEFLAMIQDPEWSAFSEQEEDLQVESQRVSPEPEVGRQPTVPGAPSWINFSPRMDLTRGFYTSSEQRREARGVQINWVGVGTWTFPVETFARRHQEAWRLAHDNMLRSRETRLKTLQKQSCYREVLRLVQEVPLGTYRKLQERGAADDNILRAMILAYHHQMREALAEYERCLNDLEAQIDAAQDPEKRVELEAERARLENERRRIDEVILFLARRDFRWL